VSELVDNGINGLLLMSFIDSKGQNFQKWQFKHFLPQKFGHCLKKWLKIQKIYQSSPFCLLYLIPSKIFPKYSSEISLRQWEFCQNCHVGKPFSSQGLPEKDRIGPWFLFPQIYFERVTNCTELIQIQLMWDTFRCITCMENAQKFGQPKKA